MSDFEYEVDEGKVTITRYTGTGGDVVIPDEIVGLPVFGIGSHAFQHNHKLRTILFGKNVTHIYGESFRECINLIVVNIPDNVNYIGYGAFKYCTSLGIMRLPVDCSIGENAFTGCPNLTIIFRDKEDE